MADDKKPAITSKWEAVCEVGKDIELPISGQNKSNIKGLKGYYYEEMIKRLNSVDKGKIDSVGYLLRKLWKRHESGLVMHESDVYSEWHEQSQKANKSEFEKKHKKKEIGFRKNESGVWGVYSDLLYDTYQKDWSKAYQLTFHYFFRNMDYLSNYMDNEFFSYVHKDVRFFAFKEKYQFGEVIINGVNNLMLSKAKLDKIHGSPNHDKAPLYNIIFGVLGNRDRSDKDMERYWHGCGYWLGSADAASADFPKLLSTEVFGHMASTAVVNPKAFDAMKEHLPNSYKMFIDILKVMVFRLEDVAVNNYKEQESSNDKLPLKKPIKLPLNDEDIDYILKKDASPKLYKMSGRIKNAVEDLKKDVEKNYGNEHYKDLAKKMVSIYLDKESNAYNKELTYLEIGKSYNKKMYVGYYDEDRKKDTMGQKFVKILRDLNPEVVIHLHPLSIKNDKSYLEWQSIFSPGDRLNMKYKQNWIGIEFYKKNENDSFYTIDVHYCSRDMFRKMLEAGYEDIARELEAEHDRKEEIEGLKRESKTFDDYLNILDEENDGEDSKHIVEDLKSNIVFLPSIKLYSIENFKKSDSSKYRNFEFKQMKPK